MAHTETSKCYAYKRKVLLFVRHRDGDEDGADFAFVEVCCAWDTSGSDFGSAVAYDTSVSSFGEQTRDRVT